MGSKFGKTNFVINLTSTKKAEQNVVRVSLVEADEQDVGIGSGISYTLVDTETNKNMDEQYQIKMENYHL